MVTPKFDVTKHFLVPKHNIISEREKKQVLEKYKITYKELPKIMANDSAIKHLKVKVGDIIKVTRISPTAGETVYYRGVINA
jgi:DNA-directed RNA polymerase subunit H